ncbi:MAG: hypothetical protein LBG47_10575 [Prevotellaceae bacterium]|jgi:transcriptional regulator with XRE-family HTH domain|nr:hypothetical protein [Prevotellaceae bacterium]
MGQKKGATVGEVLDGMLKERGMSKVEFASKMGIKRATLYHHIRHNTMNTAQIGKAAEVLGVPAACFFAGNRAVAIAGDRGTATADGGGDGQRVEVAVLRERVAALEREVALKDKLIALYESMRGQ